MEFSPKFLEDILKTTQTSRNFNFVTRCLPIPGKIVSFPEEFCSSPETDILRVDTPRDPDRVSSN